ncbi:MAG: hypothetical protein JXX28_12495 [Deltaproteobacteria bacterium]|nr:hypothetical protein [Deltaproteobacteria bacterium]
MSRSLLILVALSSCMSRSGSEGDRAPASEMADYARQEEGTMGERKARAVPPGAPAPSVQLAKAMEMDELSVLEPPEEPAAPGGGDDAAPARSWFPESFLWEPRLEVPVSGSTQLPVRVPDALTTWRVLALAHDRQGGQAGALTTFDGTLPAYLDVSLPAALYAGDQLVLPVSVRAVSEGASGTLSVEGAGALSGAGVVELDLGVGQSQVAVVHLSASGSGEGRVAARLPGVDAMSRVLPVLPQGRPVSSRTGGALHGQQAVPLAGPEGADPSTQALRLWVYPGPLGVLTAELERVAAGADQGVYGLAVTAQIQALAGRTGVEIPEARLRRARLLARQRLLRQAQAPTGPQAVALLVAMGGGDEEAELRARLVRTLSDAQRADGTWSRAERGTLQGVITLTAAAARALPPEARGARVRAGGALERYAREVDDGYTAAVVLASGLISDETAAPLRELVRQAVRVDDQGAVTFQPVDGARALEDPWGERPGEVQGLAWAALALRGSPDGDKVLTELISRYQAGTGFGAGQVEALALEAVVGGLVAVDRPVAVLLERDGAALARGELDPSHPGQAVWLEVPTGGQGGWTVRVEPEVPGLAWGAELLSWVPWTAEDALPGVELESAVSPLRVGALGTLTVRLAAPSGESVSLRVGLPPGTSLEGPSPATAGALRAWEDLGGVAQLETRPLGAGEVLEVELKLRPSFEGSFSSAPITLTSGGQRALLPPLRWTVGAAAGD